MQKSVSYRDRFWSVIRLPFLLVQHLHRSFTGLADSTAFRPITLITSRRSIAPLRRQRGQVPTSAYHSGSVSNVSSAAAAFDGAAADTPGEEEDPAPS